MTSMEGINYIFLLQKNILEFGPSSYRGDLYYSSLGESEKNKWPYYASLFEKQQKTPLDYLQFQQQSIGAHAHSLFFNTVFPFRALYLKSTLHYVYFALLVFKDRKSFMQGEKVAEKSTTESLLREKMLKQLNVSFADQINQLDSLIDCDYLTGLYNQRKLEIDLKYMAQKIYRGSLKGVKDKAYHVFFLDVDNFKSINDQFGHLVGTKILVEISKLLKQTVGAKAHLYRYGGDEFVVLLEASKHEAQRLGHKILNQFRSHLFKVNKVKFNLSFSIGMSSYPEEAMNAEDLLRKADQNLYKAKHRGKDCFHFYEKSPQPNLDGAKFKEIELG